MTVPLKSLETISNGVTYLPGICTTAMWALIILLIIYYGMKIMQNMKR